MTLTVKTIEGAKPRDKGYKLADSAGLYLYISTAGGKSWRANYLRFEHSGFAHDVIERQLAHKETDAVRAAYNRAEYLPQRRELMYWWGAWLAAQRDADQTPVQLISSSNLGMPR